MSQVDAGSFVFSERLPAWTLAADLDLGGGEPRAAAFEDMAVEEHGREEMHIYAQLESPLTV